MFKIFVNDCIRNGKIKPYFENHMSNFGRFSKFNCYPGNTWNDFEYLQLSTILVRFCKKVVGINYNDLNKHDVHLLLFYLINNFTLVEEWKHPENFDIEYKIKRGLNRYRICFEWCMKISDESEFDILKTKIEAFKSKAELLDDSLGEPVEYYFIIFYKYENEVRFTVENFTMYFSFFHAKNKFLEFFTNMKITDEDVEVIVKMKPDFVSGRFEKEMKLVYENKDYYKGNNLLKCFKDCVKNNSNNTTLNEKRLFLCFLAICNHYGCLKEFSKQNALNLFKSKNEINNDCMRLFKSIFDYKNRLLGHRIDENENEIEMDYTEHFKQFAFQSVWCFPEFKDINELVIHLKERENLLEYFLKEELKDKKTICIRIDSKDYFFDKDEFISAINFDKNYLLDIAIWKACLKDYHSKAHDDHIIYNFDIENYVHRFIEDHKSKLFKMIEDLYKDGFEYNVQKTEKLIKSIFVSIESFQNYSHENSHPKDILDDLRRKLNNNLYIDENVDEYQEIHFHLLFMMILSKSNQIEYWCAEKRCTRLHTFLDHSNTTSTGYCDVFYVDKNNNSYIIEIKFFKEYYTIYYTSFNTFVIKAIDQVRSYQLDYQGVESDNIKRFTIIFSLGQDICETPVLKCLLNDGNNEDGYEVFHRSPTTKMIRKSHFDNLNEAILSIESYELHDPLDNDLNYFSLILNDTGVVFPRDLLLKKELWSNRKHVLCLIQRMRENFQ